METDSNVKPPVSSEKKYYIDSTYLYSPRENVEVQSPLKDGLSKFHCSMKAVEIVMQYILSLVIK